MPKFLVWDQLNSQREDAEEIEAYSAREAAITYAKNDSDGYADGIYTRESREIHNLSTSGQPLVIEGTDGIQEVWNTGVVESHIWRRALWAQAMSLLNCGVTGQLKIFEKLWATHEALRRLKFPAECLSVLTENEDRVFVRIEQGGKIFNLLIARLEGLARAKFEAGWYTFATRVNEGGFSEELLAQIYNEWLDEQNGGAGLAVALAERGFLPGVNPLN